MMSADAFVAAAAGGRRMLAARDSAPPRKEADLRAKHASPTEQPLARRGQDHGRANEAAHGLHPPGSGDFSSQLFREPRQDRNSGDRVMYLFYNQAADAGEKQQWRP
jgi:hypothetical protein